MRKTPLAIGALIASSALALVALPAQAETVEDGVGFIDTQTTTDGGGVKFTVSVDWNYKYLNSAENVYVSVNPLKIEADESDFEDDADSVGIDYRWRVYSGTTKVQDVIVDGANHEGVNPVIRNPRNPRSDAGVTKIVVTRVGVDGDGLPGGPGLTFVQPAGIGFKPTPPS